MGKYMRKSKMTGEVAVMEVVSQSSLGVRTRAKTLALQKNTTSSASYLQLRSRRLQKSLPPSQTASKKTKEDSTENPNPKTSKRVVSVTVNPVSVSKKDGAFHAAIEADRNSVNAEGLPEASCGENIPEIDEREGWASSSSFICFSLFFCCWVFFPIFLGVLEKNWKMGGLDFGSCI